MHYFTTQVRLLTLLWKEGFLFCTAVELGWMVLCTGEWEGECLCCPSAALLVFFIIIYVKAKAVHRVIHDRNCIAHLFSAVSTCISGNFWGQGSAPNAELWWGLSTWNNCKTEFEYGIVFLFPYGRESKLWVSLKLVHNGAQCLIERFLS